MKPADPVWWTEALDRLVMVNVDDDSTVRGLVVRVFEDGVKLSSAERLTEGPTVALGGEIFIPREHIVSVQIPPPVRVAHRRKSTAVAPEQQSLLD